MNSILITKTLPASFSKRLDLLTANEFDRAFLSPYESNLRANSWDEIMIELATKLPATIRKRIVSTLLYYGDVDFLDYMTSIPEFLFKNVEIISEVNIPRSITKIGMQAFSSCTYLKTVTITNPDMLVNRDVFYGCIGLQKIILPKNMKVGEYKIKHDWGVGEKTVIERI